MTLDPQAILVFRSAALGDFILACPALQLLRKLFPNAKLILLTTQSASAEQRAKVAQYAGDTSMVPWVELAKPHLIDDAVVIDKLQSLRDFARIRRLIAKHKPDAAVLLLEPAAPWLGRLKKLLLLRTLIGAAPVLGWRGQGWFHRDRGRLYKRGLLDHHVRGAMQFSRELVPPVESRDLEVVFDLRPDSAAIAWAEEWIATRSLAGASLIAIAPGSIQPHKRWPLEKFKQLCEILVRELQATFVVIGTRGDAGLARELVGVAPDRIIDLTGRTTIAQSAALLARCVLLVGNDGGAVHLGDAMGTKVVSIVPGLEYPNSIEPWHNKQLAVRHTVECAPCYSFTSCPAGHNRCMTEIPVEIVLGKCREGLHAALADRAADSSP
jgi:heptosyltransferase-2